MSQKLSFFDLDHTLLKVNVSFAFGRYLFQRGEISFCKMIYCVFQYTRHKYLGLSLREMQQKIFQAYFRGLSVSKIKYNAESFLSRDFTSLLYLPALLTLQAAIKAGHQVIILSSAPDFLVEPIAKRFSINWRATSYLKDSHGKFSFLENVLDGEAKAEIVKGMSATLNIEQQNIFAYSDSYLDLPFLLSAGCPFGVNPDSKLLKVCLKNNWKIL